MHFADSTSREIVSRYENFLGTTPARFMLAPNDRIYSSNRSGWRVEPARLASCLERQRNKTLIA